MLVLTLFVTYAICDMIPFVLSMLMVRYYRYYTIVTYVICGIASVARYFG